MILQIRVCISSLSDPQSCYSCLHGYWFSEIEGGCIAKELNYLGWTDLEACICYGLFVWSFVTLVTIATIMWRHWNTPVIKAINRPLTFLQILINMAILIITMVHLGYPTRFKCGLYFILKSPLITGMVMCFVVKTQQVIKLFKSKLPAKQSRRRYRQILAVVTISSVQLIAVFTYVILRPPSISFLEGNSPSVIYVECDYGKLSVIPLYLINNALIVVCFILTFKARSLPQHFGESRYITYGVGCAYSCWVAFLPPIYMLHGRTKTLYEILLIYAYVFSLQSFYFIPKCYVILFTPEKNTVQAMRKLTLRHMRRRSSRVKLDAISFKDVHLSAEMGGIDHYADVTFNELDVHYRKEISIRNGHVISPYDEDGLKDKPTNMHIHNLKRTKRVKSVTFLEENISEDGDANISGEGDATHAESNTFMSIVKTEPPEIVMITPEGLRLKSPLGTMDESISIRADGNSSKYNVNTRSGSSTGMPSKGKIIHQTNRRTMSNLCYVTDGITRQLYHQKLNVMIDLGPFQPITGQNPKIEDVREIPIIIGHISQ